MKIKKGLSAGKQRVKGLIKVANGNRKKKFSLFIYVFVFKDKEI